MQFGLGMKDKILVIGLGYVGLPLALNLAKHYQVYGYDQSKKRIINLKKKFDTNNEIKSNFFNGKKITFFHEEKKLPDDSNIFIITVPTPVDKYNKPDLRALNLACNLVSKKYKKNDIIVLESTVAPGTTENFCLDIISKNTKLEKSEINICFSPERMNPGDKKNQLQNLNKILSANNNKSLLKCKNIYKKVCKKIFTTDSIKTAELGKLLENIQRDVNISLVNEIYKVCDIYNINYKKLLKICSTKWNFLNFKPGLVGGHCVSVDPYYLIDDLKKKKKKIDLVSQSRFINEDFVDYIYNKIVKLILDNKSKKILFYGIGFKDNVIDIRNSKYLSLCKKILSKKIPLTVFVESNQFLEKNFTYTKKLNFDNFDTIIIGSKNSKIINYIKKIPPKFKKKLIINIFGEDLFYKNKEIRIVNI